MDYIGIGRTNYFKVKNVEAFKKWVESFGGRFIDKTDKKHPELVGFIAENGEPSGRRDEKDNLITEDEGFDFYAELKSHLKKGQVAVFTESGYEGARYVTGYAVAVTPGRKLVAINIMDITELAAKKFKIPKNQITEAAY